MNTKARLLFVAMAAVMLLGAVQVVSAGGSMDIKRHVSIAPTSIPVPRTGTVLVGMTNLELCTSATVGSGPTYALSSMSLNLTTIGTFDDTDIVSIRVYFEAHGGNGVYDNGAGVDDIDVLGAGGPFTFSGGTATVAIDPTKNSVDDVANGNDHFYVVFEIAAGAASDACSIGCEVTSITYGNPPGGTGGNGSPKSVSPHNVQKPVDSYVVDGTVTGIVLNAEEYQGTTNVPVLKIELAPADGDASPRVALGSLRVHSIGDRDADLMAGGVLLYEDTNDSGTFDGGDTLLGSATLGTPSAGYAVITCATPATVPAAGQAFFVAVNVATNALVGNTVGLQIEDPEDHVVFADVIDDVDVAVDYEQRGYLTSATPTPAAGNTFDVKLQIVPQPPIVSSVVPGNNATNVALNSSVLATFSKPMKASTITTSTFRLFDGATPIAGTVTYDGPSQTATFDPSNSLDWNKTYTAVVYGDGGSGVQDDVPGEELYMASNKVWSFTTVFAVYPTVLGSTPTINQFEVPRTITVSVVFSKDMNGATITDASFTLFDGAAFVDGTVSYDGGTRTATFDPDDELDWGKAYTATITTAVRDTDGLALQNDRAWQFTTVMPVYPIVVSRTPVQGAIEVDIGANLTATFSKDIDASSIVDDTTCLVFIDGDGDYLYDPGDETLVSSDAALSAARVVTLDIVSDLDWGTTYTVNITEGVKDTDGLFLNDVSYWFFTTKVAVNPVVSNTQPAPDATGVLPNATVVVTFSRDMRETETEAAFSLHVGEAGGALVAGIASLDTLRVLTFTPDAPLTPGQKYTAVVEGNGGPGSARATDLLYMLIDKTWSFWVSSRPEVLLESPAGGSVGVSRGTTIKAVFSKDVDDATVTATTFLVESGAGTPVAGTVTYDDTTFTATFTPDADLLFASYTATIVSGPAGVKDPNGIELAADVVWTFTTIPSLSEPVAASNRITPSSTNPVTVFIPQPPAGATDRVTVQVFTATGKKVATLVNSQPWSAFQASLPLEWNGTNGLGEPLGPGLYFIQIRATGYLRTLKVMIIR